MATRSEAMDTTPRGTLGIELIIVRSLFPVFPRRALYMQTWCVGGLDRRRRNCSIHRSPRKLGEGEHPLEFEAEDVAAFWIGGDEDVAAMSCLLQD